MKIQATGLYLQRGEELLFLVRNKKNDTVHKQGMYLPIGGKVEPGESLADCVIREAFEEASLKIRSVKLRAVHYICQLDGEYHDWINFIYTSDDFEGEPRPGNEGHFEWVHRREFAKKQMYEGDRTYLKYLHDYAFYVAEFTYQGFELNKIELLTSY